MKTMYTFILLACISNISLGQKLNLSKTKTSFTWTGKSAFDSYSLTGTLLAKNGSIQIEKDSIKKLEVVIDMKTLHHENKDLKKHLKNKDFFEIKKYKTATFRINTPVLIKKNKAIIVGDMTIKNTTRIEEIEIEILKSGYLSISFNTKINRTKYGVKFNSPSIFNKIKENAIADEFVLAGKLIFN